MLIVKVKHGNLADLEYRRKAADSTDVYQHSHATDAVDILPAPTPFHPHPGHRLKTYRLYEKSVSSNSVADMYKRKQWSSKNR